MSNEADTNPPYAFGQTVYVVRCNSHARSEVPCPVCYGKSAVTLILGNDERVSVECDYCTRGIGNPPSGIAYEYGVQSSVIETTVTGMTRDGFNGVWWIECASYRSSDSPIFLSRDEAEAERAKRHAEAEKYATERRWECEKHARRKVTWHAGYHTSEARRARESAAWHERKAALLKESAAFQCAQAKEAT